MHNIHYEWSRNIRMPLAAQHFFRRYGHWIIIITVMSTMLWGAWNSRQPMRTNATQQQLQLASTLPPLDMQYHETRYIEEYAQRGAPSARSLYRSYRIQVESDEVPEAGTLVDHWYVVGPRDKEADAALRVAVVCGQHARELISSELCHHLIALLYQTHYHPTLSPLLEELHRRRVQFWVLPVVNRWGREQVQATPEEYGCLRTNRFHVDLNRNFPCPDLEMGAEEKGSESWGGPHPLSELESRATDRFLQLAEPEVLLNVHSGVEQILLPYDCCPLVQAPYYSRVVRLIQRLKRPIAEYAQERDFHHVRPGQWYVGQSAHLLYVAHGTLQDYALTQRDVSVALTLEVFQQQGEWNEQQQQQATPSECLAWFNPQMGAEYAEVVETWLFAVLKLCEGLDDTFVAQ